MSQELQTVLALRNRHEFETTKELLVRSGYVVRGLETKSDIVKFLEVPCPTICLLDFMFAGSASVDLIRDLGRNTNIGLIVVSDQGDNADIALHLELGADDSMPRPLNGRLLIARVRSLARRLARPAGITTMSDMRIAKFADWTFNLDTHTLLNQRGRRISLTSAEASMLLHFLRSPMRILSREQLQQYSAATDDVPLDRSIDVRVSRIRKKLEDDAREQVLIKTIYGAGYMFSAQVHWIS